MSRFASITAAILAVQAAPAGAATLNVFTQDALGATCESQSVQQVQAGDRATASCGSFAGGDGIDTRAEIGSVGLRSQVRGPFAAEGLGGDAASDFWRGAAFFADTLSFSEDSGIYRLEYDIAASLIEDVTGSFGGSSFPAGRNATTFSVNFQTVFQRFTEYTNSPTTGLAEITFTENVGNTGIGFIDLAFTGGSLDLSVGISHSATCGAQHSGSFPNKIGTCHLGIDAFNSLRLTGSSVLDQDGSLIADAVITSASGFDYAAGLDPHDVQAIPLPAGLGLLLTGLLGLGLATHREFWRRRG